MGPEFAQLVHGKQPPHEPVILKVKVPAKIIRNHGMDSYEIPVFDKVPPKNIREIPFNKAEKMMLSKHGRDEKKVKNNILEEQYINRIFESKKLKLDKGRIFF